MNQPLDQLTKTELIALLGMKQRELESKEKAIQSKDQAIESKDRRIEDLEGIIAKFQRTLFGQKRERFESSDQLSLPFEATAEQQQAMELELTEKVEYVRRKSGSSHPGRTKLPEHLPVEEIELYPEGNLEEMTCIGKEITEELDYKPAQFIIRRYIRYKYVSKAEEGKSPITIAPLPSR
ncbi:zinc-finger binding domain of transposase IS66 [Algoriphagus hitonicola]|uniref:Zinc-finger binding domain of transposase IS66 n=1 Tax=Algoriphagus hitonicola TaxID=435880 RepID=A0A1I2XS12_9BACT|nr:zinc-finger binding domain of transposase IS66 [Algoriphagus hitonicola]